MIGSKYKARYTVASESKPTTLNERQNKRYYL